MNMKSITLFVLAFAFSLYSCKTSSESTVDTAIEVSDVQFKHISSGILTGDGAEEIGKGEGFVIQSEKEWQDLRTKMNSINETQEEISIDFEQRTVLAYFDVIRTTGGYSVEMVSIKEDASAIEVSLQYTSPSDMAVEIMTQPYHIVSIPKTSKQVKFTRITE